MTVSMKEWALKYADLGLAVFPLRPRDKRPATENGCKAATINKRQISNWWDRYPDCNIGIATGSKSGGLLVIDLDEDEEKDKHGYEVLKEWQREHGELPETWQSITGRGGYHFFFRDSAENRNRTGLYDGIDIRGEGGYIVAPPSLHPNGRRYEWEQGPGDCEIAQADTTVINFLMGPETENWDRHTFTAPETIPDGQRHSVLISLIGSLKSKGLGDETIRAAVRSENDRKCCPPLTDRDLEKTIFPALKRGWEAAAPYYKTVCDFSKKQRNAIMRAANPELDQTLRGDFEDIEYFENINTSKLPVFNTSWLPYDFQKFSDALAECLQISPDMSGVSVLIIASSAVQKKYQVNPKPGWYEPLNLYAAIVAEPSERKSQTQRAVTDPVYVFEKEENERREPEISQFETKKNLLEGKIRYMTGQIVRGKKRNEVQEADLMEIQRELSELQEVSPLRLIADDTTSEALIKLLEQNDERMSVISSEGGIFQIMAGLYNSDKSNIDIYLKAYSGDPVFVDRKTSKKNSLQHPALTVLLFVQRSIIQEVMENKQFRGRGLLARFLYVFPKSLIGNRKYLIDAIPEWISDNYEMAVRRLLEIAIPANPGTIKYDDGAFKLAESFFYEIEKQLPDNLEEIKDWAGKFHGQTMRIAGVLHCMEHFEKADQILLNENTMRNAIEMGRFFLAHAKAAFDIMGITETQQVKDAKYILKKIDSLISQNTQNTQNINKRKLQQLCRGHFPIGEDMKPGLNELVERNYIRIGEIRTEKAGRPSEVIYINPEYINDLKEKQPGNNIAGGYENTHSMENMDVDSESEYKNSM